MTPDEYRAALLNPIELRARALAIQYGHGAIPEGEPRPDLIHWPPASPELPAPPPPPPVWICRPPDWSPDWSVKNEPWRGPWTFGAHRYRPGSGRMIGGRATFHGRLNWAASKARYKAWSAEINALLCAWRDEERALFRQARAIIRDLLRPHCVTVRSRDRGVESLAICRTVPRMMTHGYRREVYQWDARRGIMIEVHPWDEQVTAWLVFDEDWIATGWHPGWRTEPDFAQQFEVIP
jgi:hypothetical protein